MLKKTEETLKIPSKNGETSTREFALSMCLCLEEKKAANVLLLDLHKVNPYFEYFLIASASSPPHLSSLAQELRKNFLNSGSRKIHSLSEGSRNSGWLILDLTDIIVHLFLEEQRSFYNLERLWGDADIISKRK